MNLLIDKLPTTIEIDGCEYAFRWDFRTMILFELLMQDEGIALPDKCLCALELFYLDIPGNTQAAMEFLLYFYRCGKESESNEETKKGGSSENRVYSFEYDDDLIYSAFLSQYGIDLQEVENLHWWKFRAMLRCLDSENAFVRVMGYRTMEIPPGMAKEQKEFYRRMKKIHALPLPASEREKTRAIESALLGDGDLRGLV